MDKMGHDETPWDKMACKRGYHKTNWPVRVGRWRVKETQ